MDQSKRLPLPHAPQFSGLYIVSFVVITVGFVMFNAVPTYTPVPESSDSAGEEDDGV